MAFLTFINISQSFGAVDIFTGLSANIPKDAKIGLVGPNGIGKTTLLTILAGLSEPKMGQVQLAKGATIGYLHQEAERTFANNSHTVYEEMLTVFAELRATESHLRDMESAMNNDGFSDDLLEAYGEAQEAFELAGGYDYEVRIQQVLDGLGFRNEMRHMPLEHCSGGQKTRALLARLLLEKPNLLILDEPTNHLDIAAVEWLENALNRWDGAVLIVSHDRYFLDKVVGNIWEMSRTGLERYRGTYSAYLHQREERWARRDNEFTAVKERFLKDLDFVKRNIVRASTTDRAKGVLKRLIREVKAVELGGIQTLSEGWLRFTSRVGPLFPTEKWNVADTERHIKGLQNPSPRHHRINMRLPTTLRGGNIVLRTTDLQIGFPDTALFAADDIELLRLECVALIGPNGTGKTTFLRTIMGDLEPLTGEFKVGANLEISYFAQTQDSLNVNKSVLDELLSRQNMPLGEARAYLARYLFRGEDVFKLVGALSGGEQGRLALAIMALQTTNFLILDEPTNHLDIPAQEVLEDALRHFAGTILLVTHDRYLVDKLATQIWELQDGHLNIHNDDYQSFLAMREQEREKARTEAEQKAKPTVKQQQSRRNGRVTTEKELAKIEALIQQTEGTLRQMEQALETASQTQDWAKMQTMGQDYNDTQTKLEELFAQWELLSNG